MLKTKPLTQLLSQSISPHVTSAFLFTPSGSLLATNTSPIAPDSKKSRTYAALAANIWAAYERTASTGAIDGALRHPTTSPEDPDSLSALTVELSEYNMHIQLVAPRVLLCLVGPKDGTRHSSSRSSAHSETPVGSAPRSSGSVKEKAVNSGGALGVLKTQAQALVEYLEKELKGYELPEGL